MAETQGAWGIDIGQAGLKAVRLRYAEAARQVIAVAYEYVPHPKILSQPDANPDELITQALQTFLNRNDVRGDSIAISVPGRTSLAKFIQLPPVEASKVVEIVKYEARQQIPFALEEVIWDFQPLGGGSEASGYLIDAEVGLFAMKREQVNNYLAPYLREKVEVDLIQTAPLALYNYLCHDHLGQVPGGEAVEDDGYTVVLDMGCDDTTLMVTNGRKIWIRNVNLGGNHFTRALTKEMKLTFAKAEHLKCNATKAPDPKAIFQALRPVFNDYVAEIQRSIGYFSSVNRAAKIKKVVGVGNGFKLAGLQKFLQQNLQIEVERAETFPGLAGDSVLGAPLFQENLPSFAVAYGLALQGLKLTRIHTSLLPPEITRARLIRKKKPWALATAASLMAGLSISLMGYSYVWGTVSKDRFGEAEQKASQVVSARGSMKSAYNGAEGENKKLRDDAAALVEPSMGREHWLEVYKAVNECLPRDLGDAQDELDPTRRHRIRIYSITTERYSDLGTWFSALNERSKTDMRKDDRDKAPSGAGYVFTLMGRHFHDDKTDPNQQEVLYVVNTLLRNLQSWMVKDGSPIPQPQMFAYAQAYDAWKAQTANVAFPAPPPPAPGFGVRQIGISHATLPSSYAKEVWFFPKGRRGQRPGMAGAPAGGLPDAMPAAGKRFGPRKPADGNPGATPMPGEDQALKIKQTDFVIQFVWVETPADKRTPLDPADAEAAAAAAQAATVPGAVATPGVGTVPTVPPAHVPAVPPNPAPGGASAIPGAVPASPVGPAGTPTGVVPAPTGS